MNKIILSIAFSLVSIFAYAQEATSFDGKAFGESVTKGDVITTAEINAKLGDKTKADMKVTGVVTLVCQKKGCFMNLAMPNGETMFVNFKDYAFYCEPDDVQSIRKAIDKAFQSPVNPNLRKRMLENYTWEQTAIETLKAYALAK